MNDAVYKFKRYEDASLVYVGIDKHEGEDIGLYDTVLNSEDYLATFENISYESWKCDYIIDSDAFFMIYTNNLSQLRGWFVII